MSPRPDRCSPTSVHIGPTQTTPAVVGHDAVLDRVKGFMDRGAEFKVLKTVALGPIVLNERDDILAKGFGDGPGNAGLRAYRVAAATSVLAKRDIFLFSSLVNY